MKNLSILILLLASFKTFAQSPPDLNAKNNKILAFEKTLIDNYKPDEKQIALMCENSCVFIRFKISGIGKVSELKFSKEIPLFIKDALYNAFKATEDQLSQFSKWKSDSTIYLLPFIYYYNAGCYVLRKEEVNRITNHEPPGKPINEDLQGTALFNMLMFTDKNFDTLHCTILNPIQTGKKDE